MTAHKSFNQDHPPNGTLRTDQDGGELACLCRRTDPDSFALGIYVIDFKNSTRFPSKTLRRKRETTTVGGPRKAPTTTLWFPDGRGAICSTIAGHHKLNQGNSGGLIGPTGAIETVAKIRPLRIEEKQRRSCSKVFSVVNPRLLEACTS